MSGIGMSPLSLVSHLASGGALIPAALAIFLGALVLEDPTAVIVGVLAADGRIGVPLALGALYVGIVLGDLSFYGLGYFARGRARRARRLVEHDLVAPLRAWIESRYALTILCVRFVPGLRLPTYAMSGFFRSPLSTFIPVALGAAALWTTLLFGGAYAFGSLTAWLGAIRYGIAGFFLLALYALGRRNLRATTLRETAS